MKLYVDDIRRCPDGWKLARTITDAISHLWNGRVKEISLDHDIAFIRGTDIRMHKESFMAVALFMSVMPAELRPQRVRIHTANIDAGWKMHDLLRKAGFGDVTVVPLGDQVLAEDLDRLFSEVGAPARIPKRSDHQPIAREDRDHPNYESDPPSSADPTSADPIQT